MKKINYIKFVLDLILGIIFSLLFNHRVLGGVNFHETAGLAIGFAVLLHILLNAKWVKMVTLSIFGKETQKKTRIKYILNILLLLDLIIIVISGIFISKFLFPNLHMQNGFFNQETHIAASYIGLGLIGIHIGLHWRWAMGVFKKIFRIKKAGKLRGYVAKAVAVLVFAFGIYSMIYAHYFQNAAQIFQVNASAEYEYSQVSNGEEGGKGNHFRNFPDDIDDDSGYKNGSGNSYGGLEGGVGADPVSVSTTYLSIMAVFAIVTYYIDESSWLRKKTNSPKRT